MSKYQRELVKTLADRLNEPRGLIQVVMGPRQTGKTTALGQALKQIDYPFISAQAGIGQDSQDWLRAQWAQARNMLSPKTPHVALVIDEAQQVSQWSAVVKSLWDEDTRTGADIWWKPRWGRTCLPAVSKSISMSIGGVRAPRKSTMF